MPDKQNSMRYYGCLPEHFSTQQYDMMYQTMLFHPSRNFLLGSNPDCLKKGKVNKVFLLDGEEIFQLVFDGTGDFSSANVTLVAESLSGQRVRDPVALQLKNFAIGKNGEIRPIILKVNGKANNLLSFEAMPNPFENELNLQVQLAQSDEITIEIHNILGQSIFENNIIIPKGKQQISLNQLTNFSNGIYWVSVKSGNQKYSKKIVKSK